MHKVTLNLFNGVKRFYSSNKKVALIGSGNWGTVVSKIVGENLAKGVDGFEGEMMMYVKGEMVGGRSLCDVINETRVNHKYSQLCTVPLNVKASSDLAEVTSSADLLIFVFPHQFVNEVCSELKGRIKEGVRAVSLIKGFDVGEGGGLELVSDLITTHLHIPCPVVMGANIANEVAKEMYSEATIGCEDVEYGKTLRSLFARPYYRLVVTPDAKTVELCGALKNIVATGAGLADGLGCGRNTHAAVMRLGLMEMIAFVKLFHRDYQLRTFFESCGIADLITTAAAGRNHLVAMEFARKSIQSGSERVSLAELEEAMLGGGKLQGPATAADVAALLASRGLQQSFPIFSTINDICTGRSDVTSFLHCLHNHPLHL